MEIGVQTMTLNKLSLVLNKNIYPLPDWIKFSFGLGAFLYEEGYRNRTHLNIVITLPTDDYFALFASVGIADKIFSTRRQAKSIRKQIMSLSPGSRIIYTGDGDSRKVSVLSLEPSPIDKEEMLLFVEDRAIRRGIPERQWLETIVLLDEEFDQIKRPRKVSNKEIKISSHLLKSLYSSNLLNQTSFYPGEAFYLVGATEKLSRQQTDSCFVLNKTKGAAADFLYIENLSNHNSYINGKFFSSSAKKPFTDISSKIPVIYSDASSFRKQQKNFKNNSSLIVISRTDPEYRLQELSSEITRRILQEEGSFAHAELQKYLQEHNIPLPSGIELIVWRGKDARAGK